MTRYYFVKEFDTGAKGDWCNGDFVNVISLADQETPPAAGDKIEFSCKRVGNMTCEECSGYLRDIRYVREYDAEFREMLHAAAGSLAGIEAIMGKEIAGMLAKRFRR